MVDREEVVAVAAESNEEKITMDDIFFNDGDEEELVSSWFASSSTTRPEVDEWLTSKALPPRVGLGAVKIVEEKNKKTKEMDAVTKQVMKANKREKDRMDMLGLANLDEDKKKQAQDASSDEEEGRSSAMKNTKKKADPFAPWQMNAKKKRKR